MLREWATSRIREKEIGVGSKFHKSFAGSCLVSGLRHQKGTAPGPLGSVLIPQSLESCQYCGDRQFVESKQHNAMTGKTIPKHKLS